MEHDDSLVIQQPTAHPSIETAWFETDGLSAVLYDERVSMLHRINGSGAIIWSMCDGDTSTDDLVSEIAEAFVVSPASIEQDVHSTLREFWNLGLLVGSPEPIRVVLGTDIVNEDVASGALILPGASDP